MPSFLTIVKMGIPYFIPIISYHIANRHCPAPTVRRLSDGSGVRQQVRFRADRGIRGHAGVDMLAPRGTPVRAVESGTVVRAHWSGSSGGWTITLHGKSGSTFFYAHNDVNLVKSGESVTSGEVIAKVGSTGNAGTTKRRASNVVIGNAGGRASPWRAGPHALGTSPRDARRT